MFFPLRLSAGDLEGVLRVPRGSKGGCMRRKGHSVKQCPGSERWPPSDVGLPCGHTMPASHLSPGIATLSVSDQINRSIMGKCPSLPSLRGTVPRCFMWLPKRSPAGRSPRCPRSDPNITPFWLPLPPVSFPAPLSLFSRHPPHEPPDMGPCLGHGFLGNRNKSGGGGRGLAETARGAASRSCRRCPVEG